MNLPDEQARLIAKRLRDLLGDLANLNHCFGLSSVNRFKEIDTLATQSMLSFFIANIAKYAGLKVDTDYFPILAIRAAARKYKAANITGEEAEWLKGKLPGIDIYDEAIKQAFEGIHPDIISRVSIPSNTIEEDIFNLAGKMIKRIELKCLIYPKIMKNEFNRIFRTNEKEIQELIQKLEIPNFIHEYRKCQKVIIDIYFKLSNEVRWKMQSRTQDGSVIGHSFSAAVIAYVEALENGYEENIATHFFNMGLFHDLSEFRTGDMQSTFKDSIPGLRKATEDYERLQMETAMYPRMPKYQADALKKVDYLSAENSKFHPWIVGADSLSAVCEAYQQFQHGSKDLRFWKAIDRVEGKYNNGEIVITKIGRCLLIGTSIEMR